jgi:hypothetical protein
MPVSPGMMFAPQQLAALPAPTPDLRQIATQSVQVPTAPDTTGSVYAPSPAEINAQEALLGANQGMMNLAVQQLKDAPGFSPVQYPNPTGFEQGLQQSLQKQITDTLAQRQSFGDRFGRGFDQGQKVAANVLVPLVGLFGGAGGAAGALQATQSLNQNVRDSQQLRMSHEQALNSALVNLSSLYESLDPKSAKNAAALMKFNLERLKMVNDMRQQAFSNAQNAIGGFSNQLGKLSEIQRNAANDKATAQRGDFSNQLGAATLQANLGERSFNNRAKLEELAQGDKRIKQSEDQLAFEKLKDTRLAEQFKREQTLREKAAESAAANQYLTQYRLPMVMSLMTNTFGGPKVPGLQEAYNNDPGALAAINKLRGLAGIPGEAPKTFFPQQQAPAAPPTQPGLMDWLRGSTPAPKPPAEAIMKDPSKYIQINPEQVAAAKANPMVLLPLIRELGTFTPEQEGLILHNLLKNSK